MKFNSPFDLDRDSVYEWLGDDLYAVCIIIREAEEASKE